MAVAVEDLTDSSKRDWIVESGATSHMTGHLDNIVCVRNGDESRELNVTSGDTLMATAVGQAPIMAHGQELCVLQKVQYAHELARNLVSVAAASRN